MPSGVQATQFRRSASGNRARTSRPSSRRCQRSVPSPVGGDHQAAVGRDIGGPDGTGGRLPPARRAVGVEGTETPLGAEHEAPAVRGDRQAARLFIGLQRQRRAVERRAVMVFPVVDREGGLLRGPGLPVRGRVEGERQPRQVEAGRGLPPIPRSRSRPRRRRRRRGASAAVPADRPAAAAAPSAAPRPRPAPPARGPPPRPAARRPAVAAGS